MKIYTALDQIQMGMLSLPVFQRSYVWTRPSVIRFFDSLYRGYPVGSLLTWSTSLKDVEVKGDVQPAAIPVNLLLDGQQRLTTLYSVIKGELPPFFDGDKKTVTGLHFHVADEKFGFPSRSAVKKDPSWINVTALMQKGPDGVHLFLSDQDGPKEHFSRLLKLLNIRERDLPVDAINASGLSLDEVVDIFNRVNSGGTKLSKGDLALAKMCATWPDARDEINAALDRWRKSGREFKLDWFLRTFNAVATGEADFEKINELEGADAEKQFHRTVRALDICLDMVAGSLGLDHTKVLFGRTAFAVMAHYIAGRGKKSLTAAEKGKLLYWYVQSAIRGRYAFGAYNATLQTDLEAVKSKKAPLDRLIEELERTYGDLTFTAKHFEGSRTTSLLYPTLYLMTRRSDGIDWCSGEPLRNSILNSGAKLELHHIFPRALLKQHGYTDDAVINAVANYAFLTASCNKQISKTPPAEYLPEMQSHHPGAIETAWVPTEKKLWQLDAYPKFLERRRELLAKGINKLLADLHRGAAGPELPKAGGVATEEEDQLLAKTQSWVVKKGLADGVPGHVVEFEGNPYTLDLAWPDGLQEGLSNPVAILLDEPIQVHDAANHAGFHFFTSTKEFQAYVEAEILDHNDNAA